MNENTKLVEALDASNQSLAASNVASDILKRKLEVAEENIHSISASMKNCEMNMKEAKKSHHAEINNANSTIKSLEKGKKCLEKEIYDIKRNLDGSLDKIKHLKTDHSSLKVCKNKLDKEINKLKKVLSQKDYIILKLGENKELDLNGNHKRLRLSSLDTSSSTMPQSSSSSSKSECHCTSTTFGPIFSSMVSHWNSLPLRTSSSNSIASMITHCVKSHSTTSSLCTAQEFQEMLDRLVERAFANLRWSTLALGSNRKRDE